MSKSSTSWDLAVVRTGGKQYLLTPDAALTVEKFGDDSAVEVLLTASGDAVSIGQPTLDTTIPMEVVEQGKAKKVVILKFKPKKRVLRKTGHRQQLTKIRVKQ